MRADLRDHEDGPRRSELARNSGAKPRKRRVAHQRELEFVPWGGRRPGAGRKRRTPLALVPHRPRRALSGRHPLHVTLRIVAGCPTLRSESAHAIVRAAIFAAAVRPGFRLVHYAAMADHLHIVCEASNADSLAQNVKGLAVRLARGLNALWKRRGRLFAGRFHARELRSPREVHNVLRYVLANAHHHGLLRAGRFDPCSSAATIEAERVTGETGLARPRTWLLSTGWRRHGPLVLTRWEPPRTCAHDAARSVPPMRVPVSALRAVNPAKRAVRKSAQGERRAVLRDPERDALTVPSRSR